MRPTNPTIERLARHASVRHYSSAAVPREHIEAIVAAAQRAASSSNLQAYACVVVTDAESRKSLAHWCGDQEHIEQAPVFMAWCADLSRLDRACELRGHRQETRYVENFLIAAVDAALAAQNAVVAAESLGLGTCYIGGIRSNPREVIRLLGLPRLMFPLVGMTLGFAANEAMLRPRLPLNAVLHWERYSAQDQDAALQGYDRAMIATGIYEGRQVAVPNRVGEMEDYGWVEHSARRVSKAARVHLRDVLREQGFDLT